MNRRDLIVTVLASALLPDILRPARAQSKPSSHTHWRVRASVGFDAISFLGPLSGGSLYTEYYGAEAAEFAPRLPAEVRADIPKLWAAATTDGFGLLGPNLDVFLSTGGNDASIDTILAALEDPETRILPPYRASQYWNVKDWSWFKGAIPRLQRIFAGMREAGFADFRAKRAGAALDARVAEVQRALDGFDVINWQEKFTARRFDPNIEVVLLLFSKPHGIKVQGQTFLQAFDYDTATTVRIAAHEMLHPPVPMDGDAAKDALTVLGSDPLIMKIVREHDPKWGYTSLAGMFNEDLVQALDQMISEALGVARNPADRWRASDDGMHVMAAGFYGLLREDHWQVSGGNLEQWLQAVTASGRLAPNRFHAAAARALERPAEKLWPVATANIAHSANDRSACSQRSRRGTRIRSTSAGTTKVSADTPLRVSAARSLAISADFA
jgi:hypothetical protein